jgi:hypothetical protein
MYMARPELAEELEQLVASARRAEPPALSSMGARSMVKRVLSESAERSAASRRRARYAGLAVAAALLLCSASYAFLRRSPSTEIAVAADGFPLRLSLETGDTLVLAPAARLQVLSEQPAVRRVRLEQGDALFDVSLREPNERFEVLTPHTRVRVRGTVFSVRVDAKHSVVRVHEGGVWTGRALLETGSVWTSDGKAPTAEERDARALAADIRAALDARVASKLRAEPDAAPAEPVWEAARTSEPVPIAPAAEPDASTVSRRASASSAAARDQPEAEDVEQPDIHQLRELVRLGHFNQVVHFARARSDQDDAFALILADGLRALGRFTEACAEYEELAARAPEPLQTQAAFAAAQLALLKLNDAERALRAIEVYAISRTGSPLAERASVLHVQALLRLGRMDEARLITARYVAREPDTEAKERIRQLVDPLHLWQTADPPAGKAGEGKQSTPAVQRAQ